MLFPKARQVLRYLHRTRVGGQNVKENGHPIHRDSRCGLEIEQVLDSGCQIRLSVCRINYFGFSAIRQGKPLGDMLVQQILLRWRKPGFDDGFCISVLDIFKGQSPVANLLDEHESILLANLREFEFGTPFSETIQA